MRVRTSRVPWGSSPFVGSSSISSRRAVDGTCRSRNVRCAGPRACSQRIQTPLAMCTSRQATVVNGGGGGTGHT